MCAKIVGVQHLLVYPRDGTGWTIDVSLLHEEARVYSRCRKRCVASQGTVYMDVTPVGTS